LAKEPNLHEKSREHIGRISGGKSKKESKRSKNEGQGRQTSQVDPEKLGRVLWLEKKATGESTYINKIEKHGTRKLRENFPQKKGAQ